jgi:murein tripeptide amidase MpaA
MKLRTIVILLAVLCLLSTAPSSAQQPESGQNSEGFVPDTSSVEYKQLAATGWGYGYDTLRYDLQQWKKSPFATIDSIGATFQKRAMYMVTIQDTTLMFEPRKRIWIHARTHPNEVQGTWVTNEIIKFLLGSTPIAQRLRDSCIFNIVPMYNPDGVELGKPRENANGIDIESNWSTTPSQPEVAVLRATFTRLMALENPSASL